MDETCTYWAELYHFLGMFPWNKHVKTFSWQGVRLAVELDLKEVLDDAAAENSWWKTNKKYGATDINR